LLVGSGSGELALLQKGDLKQIKSVQLQGAITSVAAHGDHYFVGTNKSNVYYVNAKTFKEELRQNYSKLANEFENDLNQISVTLGTLDGELQAQKEIVQQLQAKLASLDLQQVKQADQECDAAGIEENEREYTTYSVEDLEFDYGVVQNALQKKNAFIDNQIVARNMTNLTPQQLEEFESTFKAFDKNNTNTLNKLEFKACLQGLDKEFEDSEFDEKFASIAHGKEEISFEQFTQFMISITEDRTTPEQLRDSFRAISKGKDHITEMDLRAGQVPPEMVEYLKSTLPPKEGVADAYDFEAYLTSVFQH